MGIYRFPLQNCVIISSVEPGSTYRHNQYNQQMISEPDTNVWFASPIKNWVSEQHPPLFLGVSFLEV